MIELKGAQEAQKALKEIAEGIDGLAEEALKTTGREAIELVKARTPVKTGRLANNHKMRMVTKKSLELSNDVEYARAVEYGSSTAEPQPHWRPALEVAKKYFVESYVKNGKQFVERVIAKNRPQ